MVVKYDSREKSRVTHWTCPKCRRVFLGSMPDKCPKCKAELRK